MTRYPHALVSDDTLPLRCRCGLVLEAHGVQSSDYGDDCPAALRARVDELERHVGSLHKATARGMDHERAAVVAYLVARAEEADDPWMSFCAVAIERGEHREAE